MFEHVKPNSVEVIGMSFLNLLRYGVRKCSVIALAIMCLLGFTTVVAEEREERTEEFRPVEVQIEDRAKAFTLPEVEKAVPGSYRIGNTEITVELHQENIRFKATTGTVERVQWVSETDEYGRFIYNEDKKKFERLTHSVRIVMDDYEKLKDVIEETEAKSGKAFPELNFAIVNLPKEIHPLKFSEQIKSREDVKSAAIEIETPRQIPL